MKRAMVTRKKFYDIRRDFKKLIKMNIDFPFKGTSNRFEVSNSTVSKVIKAKNFQEYKKMGSIYGKGVKVLRLRYLFILLILVSILLFINLK